MPTEPRHSRHVTSVSLRGILIAALVVFISGCRLLQNTTELPGKAVGTVTQTTKNQPNVDPVELQQQLIRFADDFTAGIVNAAEQLQRGTNALDRIELGKWKLVYASDTMAIASGQNPVSDLLDMLVLTTMTRKAVEEYWLPKVYGESARPLLAAARDAEDKIWRLAAPILKPGQAEELRQAIADAYARDPNPRRVSHFRAVGLAAEAIRSNQSGRAGQPTSVFSLLQIDPLAGLDPAAREIAQTRLFAERALYVSQRMPLLLRWQTELLSYQMAATPEAGLVLTNFNRFGLTADALTRISDQLPALVNNQREAAIKQLLDGIASERTNLIASLAADDAQLRPTLAELRQTLDAGTGLTKSADELVKSTDRFLQRFDKGPNEPAVVNTNSRPFDILDYAATAKEMTLTLKELNTAMDSLDRATPRIQRAGETLQVAGNRLINRLFFVGAGLIALLAIALVAVAVVKNRLEAKPTSTGLLPRS